MEIRKSFNLSQELFSMIIGCAKKTLVCYEKGTSTPNDNFSIILNTLIYKPKLIYDFVEANKDNFTYKQYETIMKKLNTKK
jgi:DNA-binding XRE family transcriptional regulator